MSPGGRTTPGRTTTSRRHSNDPSEFADRVREVLAAAGDPERAAGQQRYMKSTMPFHGITLPQLRVLLRPLFAEPFTDRGAWEQTIRELFDEATHREHWYAALALLRHRHYRTWRNGDVMPLVRHIIERSAWWDITDDAAHVVAEVRLRAPRAEADRLRGWSAEEVMWVRRAAIIGQLGARDQTDTSLLTDVIDANLADREFFIRKAVGWALRDYARTAPDWVREFVDARGERLSPLSRREASKHL